MEWAGIVDHVRVGDRVAVADRGAVIGDTPADVRVAGFPGRPEASFERTSTAQEGLPELFEDVRRIGARLGLTVGSPREDR